MALPTIKLLIAATGSVAAMKIPMFIESLLNTGGRQLPCNFEIHLVVTERARHFFKMSDVPAVVKVYDDNLEWQNWKKKGDSVLHTELAKIADMMAIVPLNANTLAKVANGICDNLVTCTIRSWEAEKPLIFCPAMTTRTWNHPITSQQISLLKQWGYTEIPPVNKKLACGEVGYGAMADIDTIVEKIGITAEKNLNVHLDT